MSHPQLAVGSCTLVKAGYKRTDKHSTTCTLSQMLAGLWCLACCSYPGTRFVWQMIAPLVTYKSLSLHSFTCFVFGSSTSLLCPKENEQLYVRGGNQWVAQLSYWQNGGNCSSLLQEQITTGLNFSSLDVVAV